MSVTKHNLLVTMGLAGALALGVCGCSFSSESTSTSSLTTEVTSEDGTTNKTTTESTTTVGTNGVSSETSTTKETIVSVDTWSAAWKGTSSTGESVFYAQSPDDKSQALLAIYNPNTAELETYIGSFEMVAENALRLTDVGSDNSYIIEILSNADDEGTVELNLGDEHGTVTMLPCSMDELIDGISEVDTEGVFISK